MPVLELHLQGDGAFAPLQARLGQPIHLTNAIHVAGLDAGMREWQAERGTRV
jgi:hypothetical protein